MYVRDGNAIAYILAACLGAGAGCGIAYEGEGAPNRVATADCGACHGRQGPDANPDAIRRDIIDTHYDDWHFTAEGEFSTEPSDNLQGYVLAQSIPWAQEGQGYVTADSEQACSASCHQGHDQDSAINEQWKASGHSNILAGAFEHEFPTGVCLRCHSGAGFATYVDESNAAFPGWRPPGEDIFSYIITCNACHDAEGYPSHEQPRLRKSGSFTLTSGSRATYVVDGIVDAGRSAACFSCHQGRESGASLTLAMLDLGVDPNDASDDTITGQSFINPHYFPAASMLFSLKGFEFPGSTYSLGNPLHQGARCLGCHGAASTNNALGGHAYNMRAEEEHEGGGGAQHVEACRECHGPIESFDAVGNLRDMDGDGVAESVKDEVDGLKANILEALAAEGIFHGEGYPYFFTTAEPTAQAFPTWNNIWRESQLIAAFNYQFVAKDPGAYVHNYRYAVQLLRDAWQNLVGAPVPGLRPSTADDRPATNYGR